MRACASYRSSPRHQCFPKQTSPHGNKPQASAKTPATTLAAAAAAALTLLAAPAASYASSSELALALSAQAPPPSLMAVAAGRAMNADVGASALAAAAAAASAPPVLQQAPPSAPSLVAASPLDGGATAELAAAVTQQVVAAALSPAGSLELAAAAAAAATAQQDGALALEQQLVEGTKAAVSEALQGANLAESAMPAVAAPWPVGGGASSPLCAAWEAYCGSLARAPLATKAATAVVGAFLGDLLAQGLAHCSRCSGRNSNEGSGSSSSSTGDSGGGSSTAAPPPFAYDAARFARLAAFAGAVNAPMAHYWYAFLDAAVLPDAPGAPAAVAAKILLDQVAQTPFALALFFAVLKTLEGRPQDAAAEVRRKVSEWEEWCSGRKAVRGADSACRQLARGETASSISTCNSVDTAFLSFAPSPFPPAARARARRQLQALAGGAARQLCPRAARAARALLQRGLDRLDGARVEHGGRRGCGRRGCSRRRGRRRRGGGGGGGGGGGRGCRGRGAAQHDQRRRRRRRRRSLADAGAAVPRRPLRRSPYMKSCVSVFCISHVPYSL